MHITEYLNKVFDTIAANPYVESKNLSFNERPPNAAYITGILTFINSSKLHFKEFIIYKSGNIIFLKYAYNYLTQKDTIIFRYDNARTQRLKNFPHILNINICLTGFCLLKGPRLKIFYWKFQI